MELNNFLGFTIPVNILELIAAIAGTIYLRNVPTLRSDKLLVVFLWIVTVVEIIGLYPAIAYFTDYKLLPVKDTFFVNNYWMYNSFMILSFVFYSYYFRSYISNSKWRNLLKYLIYGYAVIALINLFVSDIFLKGYSKFTTIAGTMLVFLSVVIFYFELLRSDVLLNLKRFLPFYISIGVLIFNLCITPVDIFSEYFESENDFYVRLRSNIYLSANIFLYSTYILGFVICSRGKKSY